MPSIRHALLFLRLTVHGCRCYCVQELEKLDGETPVFKLIGPALVKQDTDEAKANIAKRLAFIETEMCVPSVCETGRTGDSPLCRVLQEANWQGHGVQAGGDGAGAKGDRRDADEAAGSNWRGGRGSRFEVVWGLCAFHTRKFFSHIYCCVNW